MGIGSGSGVLTSGEQIIFKVLFERCHPPFCVFDIGANKGQFLDLTLKSIYAYDFSIHCFEPGKETFKDLCKIEVNKNIKLNNVGIGAEKGEMTLYYNAPGSGLASLTKRRLDHFGIDFNRSETVTVETVDNYCKENNISRVNLLKLDIEGHELDALRGAKEMFLKNAIDIVTFEFGGCNIDTRTYFQDFWYFFKDVNMKIFRITPSGFLSEVKSYKEIDEQFRTTNFLSIKNSEV